MNSEKTSILDKARTREQREAFVRSKSTHRIYDMDSFNEMKSYILSSACENDLDRLIRRDYFLPPPMHFQVPKDFTGRKRSVYTWLGTEKYLISLLAFTLRGYENIYSDGLYSFRSTRTGKDFLLKLKNNKDKEKYYIIRADVSNYVGSIVPELILPMLKKIWKDDPAFYDLLEFLLMRRECVDRDGRTFSWEPGGMGGIPLANHFMNVYLMDLDDYYSGRSPLYCRYSDDLIIFARDRREVEEYLAFFYRVLEEKKLSTNPEKTSVIEPGGEVEILGCKLKNGRMDISDHAKRKLKRKIRLRARRLLRQKRRRNLSDEEAGRMMIEYCRNFFYGHLKKSDLSWANWLFPVISDVTSLRELDRYVQDAVRFVMCGSMAKKRYRITYQQLRDLGYKSLVHAYYHFTYT